jgi:hypothetical protein
VVVGSTAVSPLPSDVDDVDDVAAAFAAGGALGAATAVLRHRFEWPVADGASAEELLAVLRQPEVQERVGWRQDRVEAEPGPVPGGRREVATENQGCWQAALAPDGVVDIGEHLRSGWHTWGRIDLADLLCRLLVHEAVLAGPYLRGDVRPRVLERALLLPPLEFPEGSAGLPGVVAGPAWFGIVSDEGDSWWVRAAPIEAFLPAVAARYPEGGWRRDGDVVRSPRGGRGRR